MRLLCKLGNGWIGPVVWIALSVLFVLAGCGSSTAKCQPGQRGCACVASACQAGLVCSEGTCQSEALSGLSISGGSARACEVLLADGDTKIDHVQFGADVNGRWLRQGDKVAAAFLSNRDAPLGGNAIDVAYAQGASTPFKVVASHCYGAKGEELPGASVSH